MTARSRIGITIAGLSIAFSALCFVVVLAFTPAIVPAAAFGIVGAIAAFLSGARRTALVAVVFGLVPFAEILVAAQVEVGYLVFTPAAIAVAIAALALADYARAGVSRSSP